MPDLTALQRICSLLDREEIDRGRFLALLTRHMAHTIVCSRAGVRMLVKTPNGPTLRSLAMHDAARRAPVAVPDMVTDDPHPYIRTLMRDGCVVAADAVENQSTVSFADGYLRPQDVRSLMDVSFSVNGKLYGTFSCEQVAGTQAWSPQQLSLLRHIAARVSLSLMQAVSSQVDTTPGALWEPSTPDRLMTMPLPLPLEDENEESDLD